MKRVSLDKGIRQAPDATDGEVRAILRASLPWHGVELTGRTSRGRIDMRDAVASGVLYPLIRQRYDRRHLRALAEYTRP